MNNLHFNWLKFSWIMAMAALVSVCLFICAVAALLCGAHIDDVCQNANEAFTRFVEGMDL